MIYIHTELRTQPRESFYFVSRIAPGHLSPRGKTAHHMNRPRTWQVPVALLF